MKLVDSLCEGNYYVLCACGEQCGQRPNSDPDSVDLVQRGNLSAADLCA